MSEVREVVFGVFLRVLSVPYFEKMGCLVVSWYFYPYGF